MSTPHRRLSAPWTPLHASAHTLPFPAPLGSKIKLALAPMDDGRLVLNFLVWQSEPKHRPKPLTPQSNAEDELRLVDAPTNYDLARSSRR